MPTTCDTFAPVLSTPPAVADIPPSPTQVEFVSLPDTTLDLDADHDNEMSLQFRTLDNVLESMEIPGLTEWEFVVVEELLIIIGDYESTTFKEAPDDSHWCKATIEEMTSIDENKTWALVHLHLGHRPIGLKWVYKLKRNEQGIVVRHKA